MKPLLMMRTKGLSGPIAMKHYGVPGLSKAGQHHGSSLPVVPSVILSTILSTTPNTIIVKWDRPMELIGTHTLDAFNIITNSGTAVHPHSITFSGDTMTITMNNPFSGGDKITWSYDDSHVGVELREKAVPNTEAENQTHIIANGLPVEFSDAIPFEVYIEDGVPGTILSVYNDELTIGSPFNFTAIIVIVNGVKRTVTGADLSPVDFSNLEITISPDVKAGDVVTYQYDYTVDNSLRGGTDGKIVANTINPVQNQIAG